MTTKGATPILVIPSEALFVPTRDLPFPSPLTPTLSRLGERGLIVISLFEKTKEIPRRALRSVGMTIMSGVTNLGDVLFFLNYRVIQRTQRPQ